MNYLIISQQMLLVVATIPWISLTSTRVFTICALFHVSQSSFSVSKIDVEQTRTKCVMIVEKQCNKDLFIHIQGEALNSLNSFVSRSFNYCRRTKCHFSTPALLYRETLIN